MNRFFSIGSELGAISVAVNILLLLFIFGHFYNRHIERLGTETEGWTWLQVVIGVFVTLIGIGLLDMILPGWNAFFISLAAFTASGSPMSYGGFRRHQAAQERLQKAIRESDQ